jgi:polysaccharide export outer membrane protein
MLSNVPNILSVLVLAISTWQVASAPAPVQAHLSYLIGPGDVLGVKVFEEPTLSGPFNVDSDGSITYPFIGRVPVQGKTVREVEAELTKRLTGNYLQQPQVTVDISSYRKRSIFVLGDVRTPGKYSIEGQVTLLEVIANAGSLTSTAGDVIIVQRFKDPAATGAAPAMPGDKGVNEVVRVSVDDLKEGRIASTLLLQDGDTLYIPAADKFYVSGFVRSPGQFVLAPNMTVRQALAIAGGIAERGSTRGIKIIRRVKNKEVEISVGMGDLVRAGDTIKVRQRLL